MNERDAMDRLLREAVAALDRAAEVPSDDLSEAAAIALRAIARLRDALIEEGRAEPAPEPGTRQLLDAANAALSLVSGVAYPAGELERVGLGQARDALAKVAWG